MYRSLSLFVLGTEDESLGRHRLSNDGWGSSIGSVSNSGNWGSGVGSVSNGGNWGSSVSSSGNWSGVGNSNWNLSDSVDWGGNSLGDSLDGVGAGLVDNWLVDGLVGADGSGDSLGAVGWDVLEDGLGNVVGLDNWGGLVGGNGGWDVGVGGLGHGVGQGGDLGDDLGESMSLSGGVGEVASESVVLDGSRVVSWGTDKVGGCVAHNSSSWCHSDGASTGKSDERGEKQEGVHGGSR